MRNVLILMILISGLIFTSLIKNKTRLLEKELANLNNEITILSSNLTEASLDFEYLSAPKHILLLSRNFLDENFTYYKEFQIKKSIKPERDLVILKKSKVVKEIDNRQLLTTNKIETQITEDVFAGEKTVKYLAILKKIKNDNTFSQLSTEESENKKSNFVKKIANRQSQEAEKKVVSKKVHKWVGLQIIKSFLGISAIPVK